MTQAAKQGEVIQASENQIAEYNPFEAKLTEFKKKYVGVVYDLDDEEQLKQAKADRLEIGRVISKLDSVHDDIKAPLKERVDLIDGERKRIKDQLLEVQDGIKSQIKARDERIAAHQEKLQRMVDYFSEQVGMIEMGAASSDVMRGVLETIASTDVDDTYEHRKADATLAQVDAIKKLEAMIVEAEKREAEAAELAELRRKQAEQERKDREDQIRREAEARAKQETEERHKRELEAAERARVQAEEAAKRQAQAAEQARIRAEHEAEERAAAAAKAERERIEREQREAQAKAEAEAKAEADKKAKLAHRNKIHKAAMQSLMQNGLSESAARTVVELIKDEKIEHVRIVY